MTSLQKSLNFVRAGEIALAKKSLADEIRKNPKSLAALRAHNLLDMGYGGEAQAVLAHEIARVENDHRLECERMKLALAEK